MRSKMIVYANGSELLSANNISIYPAVGESVSVHGEIYKVISVTHQYSTNSHIIIVNTKIPH